MAARRPRSPASRSGPCSCPRRWLTRRSPASRRSSASTPRRPRCCSTPLWAAPATSSSGPMAATAALSAATVAEWRRSGHGSSPSPPRWRSRRPPRPARRAAAAGLPGRLHLRAGAQGLHHRSGTDDHRRPVAQALRDREGRASSSSSSGASSATSARPPGSTSSSGSLSLAIVLGLRRVAPVVPGSLVAVLFGIAAVVRLRPGRARRRRSSAHRQRAAAFGASGRVLQDYLDARRGRRSA